MLQRLKTKTKKKKEEQTDKEVCGEEIKGKQAASTGDIYTLSSSIDPHRVREGSEAERKTRVADKPEQKQTKRGV